MKYGALPSDLGPVDVSPKEMMFWMYCPIKVPYGDVRLPANLEQFRPIVKRSLLTCVYGPYYVYLTAKTLWVSGDYIGNRPGWHTDGFGTDDLNFIWYDRAPTDFTFGEFELSNDCDESMRQMEELCRETPIVHYPCKHLLKLTPQVIHRCPTGFAPGMRTFVKVSVSKNKYDLEGNSINYKLGDLFELKPRREDRNHPSSTT